MILEDLQKQNEELEVRGHRLRQHFRPGVGKCFDWWATVSCGPEQRGGAEGRSRGGGAVTFLIKASGDM